MRLQPTAVSPAKARLHPCALFRCAFPAELLNPPTGASTPATPTAANTPRGGERLPLRPKRAACRRRRPPLQTPSPTISDFLPTPLVYFYSAAVVW